MHRNRQNNDNRRYSYLFPTNLTSAENVHYQYYDSRLRSRPSIYSNAVSRYQPLTPIIDVTESISNFDDLKLSRRSRSDLIPCSCTCVSTHLYQQIAVTDRRFITASSLRERLLTDIQQNIHEIDKELSSLQRRPLPRYLLPPNKKTSIYNNNRQRWSNEPRRMYEVIPHIKRESKIKPKSVPPKLPNQVIVHSYVGHYHYGPEIEETEIAENDPENSDPKSALDEISEFNSYEAMSLTRFRREQSPSPQNRASIFIPECIEAKAIESNEKTEDSHQNNPTTETSQDVVSTNKSNIQSSEPLIKTSPPDSVNTVPSKPVKQSTPSTRVVIKTQGEDASSSKKPVINPTLPTKPVTNTEGEDASSTKKAVTNPAPSTKPVTSTEGEDASSSKKPVTKPAPSTKPVTNTQAEDSSSSKKAVTNPAPPTKPASNTEGEDASSTKKAVTNPAPSTKPVTNTEGEDASSPKKSAIKPAPSTKTVAKTQGEDAASSKKPVTNSNPPTKTVTFIQGEDSSSKKPIIHSIDTKNTMDGDTVHFFSDFAIIGENDESRISVKPKPVPPPTESKSNNDAKVSLPEQKPTSENNDENAKKVESEKDVPTKKYSITEISTVPSSTSN